MRSLIRCLVVVAVLAAAPAAAAVGPSLWTVDQISNHGSDVSYVAHFKAGSTTVSAVRASDGTVLRSTSLPGKWGFQAVTLDGDAAGLSTNGRVLVAASPSPDPAVLRSASAFTVLRTDRLAVTATIRLRGDFTVDTLSPDGRVLYLIQHVQQGDDISRYRVRAYDLKAHRLLARAIADKRQTGWTMRGYPVTRAATPDGAWVYTLYQPGSNYPFVHALDTAHRSAVCIGLPLSWTGDALEGAKLELDAAAGRLIVSGPHLDAPIAIDTATLQIVH